MSLSPSGFVFGGREEKNKSTASFGFQNRTGKILTKTISILIAEIATQWKRRYAQIHVIHVVLDAPLHVVLHHLLNFFLGRQIAMEVRCLDRSQTLLLFIGWAAYQVHLTGDHEFIQLVIPEGKLGPKDLHDFEFFRSVLPVFKD